MACAKTLNEVTSTMYHVYSFIYKRSVYSYGCLKCPSQNPHLQNSYLVVGKLCLKLMQTVRQSFIKIIRSLSGPLSEAEGSCSAELLSKCTDLSLLRGGNCVNYLNPSSNFIIKQLLCTIPCLEPEYLE